MTTNTTQGYRPISKSERNLIIPQFNINGNKNKLDDLTLLIHDTHPDIITIQETKLTPIANSPKIYNFTTVRTDRLHKAGGGLLTLIRDNITFTTTGIPSTFNTHNKELQMIKVHINNTKHTTIANIYILTRDSTSMPYITADTDIQYITKIPHSVLTRDVKHIPLSVTRTLMTSECQTPHYNKHHHQISSRCLTLCTTGNHGELNLHYHQTTTNHQHNQHTT